VAMRCAVGTETPTIGAISETDSVLRSGLNARSTLSARTIA